MRNLIIQTPQFFLSLDTHKPKAMKYFLSQVMAVAILITSCAQYRHPSVTIDQAINKGNVVTVDEGSGNISLRDITQRDGHYYGIDRFGPNKGNEIKIDSLSDRKFLLSKNMQKAYRTKIKTSTNVKIIGILYQVKDSSILIVTTYKGTKIFPTYKEEYSSNNSSINEFNITDIKKISVRPVDRLKRSTGTAVLIGASSGFLLGLLQSKSFLGPFITGAILAVFGTLVALPVGLIAGSSQDSFSFNGDMGEYTEKVKRQLSYRAIFYTPGPANNQ